MNPVSRRVLAGAVLLLLAPLTLGAQQVPDTAALSPVVVTATKIPSAIAVSTAATTVIRADELATHGISTLADALRLVPGASTNMTSSVGSQTALFLRGGNSNFTKVLVDGVPVNAPGGGLDLSTLSVDNIDRIEIVRGPASVQYGSDAMTGVVQIFTREGGRSTTDVRVADRDGAGDATLGLARERVLSSGARVRASLGGGYHRTDGLLPFNNGYRSATASALAGIAGNRGGASLAATLGDSRYHYPTTGSGVPSDSNAYTGARRLTLSLGATWRATPRIGARIQLGSAATRSLSENQPDNSGDTAGFYSHSTSDARRDAADVQLFATLPLRSGLTAGVSGESQRVESDGRSVFGRGPASASRFDESRTNRAAYAQLTAGGKPVSLDAGVRRERFGTGRGVTTGRLGVASERVPGSIIRASLGTAFKEPALDELYPTSFSNGNPSLLPERNRSREIGAETRLARGLLTLGATLFEQRFANLVQYQYRSSALPDFYNIVAATARGVELEGRIAEVRHVVLHGTYTLLHTEVTEPGDGGFGTLTLGKPLVRRPRRTATIDAGWQRDRFSLNAFIMRAGARDDIDFSRFPAARVRLDAYRRLDLAGQIAVWRTTANAASRTELSATARMENATNARYESVAGYRTPGRILYLGIRASR